LERKSKTKHREFLDPRVTNIRIINKIATLPISIVKGDEDSIFSETGTVVVSSVE
jgi:hypothetical protein